MRRKWSLTTTTCPRMMARCLQVACTRLLPLLLGLTLPAAVEAQWIWETNMDGTITITGYSGYGRDVAIPSTINDLPVTRIGNHAFVERTSLTNVTIPNSVTTIGEGAFSGCTGLASVTIPDSVISIGDEAFYECGGLTSLTIPASVSSIGREAFGECTSLTSVIIPDSVTSIGEAVFAECSRLTSVTIGEGITSIPSRAFTECGSLTNITIPDSVSSIRDYAFAYCTSLTGVYFRGNAPSLGWDVFYLAEAAIVYCLPGTTGWGTPFGGRPAVLWNPQIATSDASFGVGPNGLGFTISGTANIPIVMEAAADLAAPVWIPLQTCTLTNGSIYLADPDWTNYPARFYRLRSP